MTVVVTDEFDAWTVNSMKTEKYHTQNLRIRAGLTIHLPDKQTRYGITPRTTKNTSPVSVRLICISFERMSDEFRSVNYHMVCSNHQMKTHVRTP